MVSAETCSLRASDLGGESLAAALRSRLGPPVLDKGAGEQGRHMRAFSSPFHNTAHVFVTSTCSLLLRVRLLSASSLLEQWHLKVVNGSGYWPVSRDGGSS